MILLTEVFRLPDGLLLCQSVNNPNLNMDKFHAKTQLILRENKPPVRGWRRVDSQMIHFFMEKEICFVALCDQEFSARIADLFLESLAEQFDEMYGGFGRYKILTATIDHSLPTFSNVIKKMSRTYNNVNANNLANLGLKGEEEKREYIEKELRNVEIFSQCGRRFTFSELPDERVIAALKQGLEEEDLVRFQELPGMGAFDEIIVSDGNKVIREVVDNLINEIIDVKHKNDSYDTDDESEDEVEDHNDHKCELLQSFQDIANVDGRRAKYYLDSATWQIDLALANFYSDHVPELFRDDESDSSDNESVDRDDTDGVDSHLNKDHTENMNNKTGNCLQSTPKAAEETDQKYDSENGAELILQFQDITNTVDFKRAKDYFDGADWDLDEAISKFYSDHQSDDDTDDFQDDEDDCDDNTSDNDSDDELHHEYEITMKSLFNSEIDTEDESDTDDVTIENQTSISNQNYNMQKGASGNMCAKSRNKWHSTFDINAKSILRFFGGTFVIIAYLYYLPVL